MMRRDCRRIVLTGVLLALSTSAAAAQIVTCEREWAQLAAEIGGDRVDIESIAPRSGDMHHATPPPRSIVPVRHADLLVCSDVRHEAALRRMVHESGNTRIQRGQPGYVEAGAIISGDEASPESARSWHHVERDPRNVLLIAGVLTQRLQAVDAASSEYYAARYRAFSARWRQAMQQWGELARPLEGLTVIEQRKACAYLCSWLGMKEIASVEEEGTSLAPGRMRELLTLASQQRVTLLVKGPHHISASMSWLERRTRLPVVTLPADDGDIADAAGLYTVFYESIERVLAARM
jgi:zinc/manganese transport system substrate-binding protein